ncbi:HupE/UreJ family protein [Sphaerotilaceae bacterium SBD11-9]
MIRRIALLLLAASPAVALAHTGAAGHAHDATGALTAGFTHPFTGLDHLAAMVAVGVWSAMSSRRPWLAPVAFAGALLIGAWLGLAGVTLPAVEPMIAASLLVLGLLVASRKALPPAVGGALVAAFALFHGAAHGQELAGPSAAFALIGMVSATALLHGLGLVIGLQLRDRAPWLSRTGGALVALFGAALLVA